MDAQILPFKQPHTLHMTYTVHIQYPHAQSRLSLLLHTLCRFDSTIKHTRYNVHVLVWTEGGVGNKLSEWVCGTQNTIKDNLTVPNTMLASLHYNPWNQDTFGCPKHPSVITTPEIRTVPNTLWISVITTLEIRTVPNTLASAQLQPLKSGHLTNQDNLSCPKRVLITESPSSKISDLLTSIMDHDSLPSLGKGLPWKQRRSIDE